MPRNYDHYFENDAEKYELNVLDFTKISKYEAVDPIERTEVCTTKASVSSDNGDLSNNKTSSNTASETTMPSPCNLFESAEVSLNDNSHENAENSKKTANLKKIFKISRNATKVNYSTRTDVLNKTSLRAMRKLLTKQFKAQNKKMVHNRF